MTDPSGKQAGDDAARPLPGGEGSEAAEHDGITLVDRTPEL
jgi:hypothetical protein